MIEGIEGFPNLESIDINSSIIPNVEQADIYAALAKVKTKQKAKEEADRRAKEEADRRANEEADRLAKEESDRRERDLQELQAKEDAAIVVEYEPSGQEKADGREWMHIRAHAGAYQIQRLVRSDNISVLWRDPRSGPTEGCTWPADKGKVTDIVCDPSIEDTRSSEKDVLVLCVEHDKATLEIGDLPVYDTEKYTALLLMASCEDYFETIRDNLSEAVRKKLIEQHMALVTAETELWASCAVELESLATHVEDVLESRKK